MDIFLEDIYEDLKGFVRQRFHPEGSMASRWLIQESLVYIIELLSTSDPECQDYGYKKKMID